MRRTPGRTLTTGASIRATTVALLVVLSVLAGVPATGASAPAGTATSVADAAEASTSSSFAVLIDATGSPVGEGETMTVTATVENTGDATDSQRVGLSVGGAVRDATEVTLAGGENTTVTLTWETSDGDAGTYTATVATADAAASTDVHVLAAATFRVAIDATNAPVVAGQSLDVTATVSNVGDLPGNRTVTLSVGAVRSDAREVSLSGGENTTVTLSWATDDGDAGNYTATVSTEDDAAERDVRVEESRNQPPDAGDVSVDPAAPAVEEAVAFSADASDPDGSVVAYEWQIDGEVVGSSASFQYTFEEAGDHEVRVTVTDDEGATASAAVTVTVEGANDQPSVEIVRETTSPSEGEAVTFSAEASDPDGSVGSYEWTVDGEVVGSSASLTYAFEEAGEHLVAVTVTDDAGAQSTARISVTVEANDPPTASVEYSPESPSEGETVTFSSDSSDPDDATDSLAYEWTVDGEPADTGPALEYTFEEAGEHEVRVTVTDDQGATASAAVTVTVEGTNEPPSVEIALGTTSPTEGEAVEFVADASDPDGSVESYEWTVDGEPAGSGTGLTYTFETTGDHEVALAVTDDDGATAVATRTVEVTAPGQTATTGARGTPTIVQTPGFGPAAGLVALVVAALLYRRRR